MSRFFLGIHAAQWRSLCYPVPAAVGITSRALETLQESLLLPHMFSLFDTFFLHLSHIKSTAGFLTYACVFIYVDVSKCAAVFSLSLFLSWMLQHKNPRLHLSQLPGHCSLLFIPKQGVSCFMLVFCCWFFFFLTFSLSPPSCKLWSFGPRTRIGRLWVAQK